MQAELKVTFERVGAGLAKLLGRPCTGIRAGIRWLRCLAHLRLPWQPAAETAPEGADHASCVFSHSAHSAKELLACAADARSSQAEAKRGQTLRQHVRLRFVRVT